MSRGPRSLTLLMPDDPARAEALAHYDQADEDLREVMSRLLRRGVLTDEEAHGIQQILKGPRNVKRWKLGPSAINRLTAKVEAAAEHLWDREHKEQEVDRNLGKLDPAPSDAPMLEEYMPRQPAYKTRLGSADGDMSNGQVRAVMLHPVLSEAMSCSECAEFWRRVFGGSATEADIVLAKTLGPIPDKHRDKYQNISTRTLDRWLDRAVTAAPSVEGGEPPPVDEALEHKTGKDRRNRRKVDPDLVVGLYLANPDWDGANVTQCLREEHGINISLRRVEQILQTELSDLERLIARGGVAATDVIFRSRLYRGTRRPNQVWIMDHSWIRMELVGSVEHEDVMDFDFAMQYLVESWDSAGHPVRRKAEGMWVTAIVDACTRRVLNVRVWPHSPNSDTDLLAIAEAGLRYGLPEILYTDNGADFTSTKIRAALTAAGIRQVHSLPYTPQGRGIVERFFHTLKAGVLRHLDGYTGGRHRKDWNTSELLTLAEVQGKIREWVEKFLNGRKHSATGRKPQEHFDDLVRGRVMVPSERLLPLLFRRDEVTKSAQGVRYENRYYYSPRMGAIPDKARVVIHYDPFNPQWIHVSSRGPGGVLQYIGLFKPYPRDNPPDALRVAEEEVAFRAQVLSESRAARAARQRHERIEAAKAAGRELGDRAADAVFGELSDGREDQPHASPPATSTEMQEREAEAVTPDEEGGVAVAVSDDLFPNPWLRSR